MAENAPTVRTDRNFWEEAEYDVIHQILWEQAEMINSLTKAGPIYGRVLLPPEDAARKLQLMQQGDRHV